jgi:hypothetical protein
MTRKFATDVRLRMAISLLAVAIAGLVGVVTASLAWAGIVLGIFSMVLGLCNYQRQRSPTR